MGIFSAIIGNAGAIDPQQLKHDYGRGKARQNLHDEVLQKSNASNKRMEMTTKRYCALRFAPTSDP